jgi:predicted Rossmann fold flavoprotein
LDISFNKKIAVIGGGPAGIMAAYSASKNTNNRIDLYERNEKLGKKLFITGKGRCNVTNAGDSDDFFSNITKNSKFLYSAFSALDNNKLMTLIEQHGTKLKVERGGRVFPVSDKSSDVIKALKKMLNKDNIKIKLDEKIESIVKIDNGFCLNNDEKYDAIILAGGGKSYPTTGSDGNAYELAKKLGHSITEIQSGLCGMETTDFDTHSLSGLSLKNVTFIVKQNKKVKYKNLGEMEFTHYGVSGPIVLSASSRFNIKDYNKLQFYIDLKPGLLDNQLDKRIRRDIEAEPNKSIKNTLGKLLPIRLMETIFIRSGLDSDKKVNQLTKEERFSIIQNIKYFSITPIRLRPIQEAIITRGGVKCKEINPSTMESKIVEGLYFAGEMIDIDALTGGYNLQIAFSTGYLAGYSTTQ